MTKKEIAKFHNISHPDSCPTCHGFDCVMRNGKLIACTNKTWCGATFERFPKNPDGSAVCKHHCDRRKHETGKHRSGKVEW